MRFLGAMKQQAGENGILFPTRFYRLQAIYAIGADLSDILFASAWLIGDQALVADAATLREEFDNQFSDLYVSDPQGRSVEQEIARQLRDERPPEDEG
jgi:hypothetical protein